MSWIVQNLWNNRTRIKQKSLASVGYKGQALTLVPAYGVVSFPIDDLEIGYDDPFIESDEFNDLLSVEKAIEELKDLNLLSNRDLEVLDREEDGNYNRGNPFRKTHSKHFSIICNRIAYYLGGYFTDEGYIDYLARNYRLDEDHKETLRRFMTSRFKNRILTKSYKNGKNNEQTKNVPA